MNFDEYNWEDYLPILSLLFSITQVYVTNGDLHLSLTCWSKELCQADCQ